MTVDDLTKLMLAAAVTFAIVIIAWGLFKILNNLSGTIADFRATVRNTSKISDFVLEDYLNIRKGAYDFVSKFADFKATILDPLNILAKILPLIKSMFDKKGSKRQDA